MFTSSRIEFTHVCKAYIPLLVSVVSAVLSSKKLLSTDSLFFSLACADTTDTEVQEARRSGLLAFHDLFHYTGYSGYSLLSIRKIHCRIARVTDTISVP